MKPVLNVSILVTTIEKDSINELDLNKGQESGKENNWIDFDRWIKSKSKKEMCTKQLYE